MCYTVSIYAKTHAIEAAMGATFDDETEYQPYVHVTGYAHPFLPFITNKRPKALQMMSWGLIPKWARTEQAAADIRDKTLNARIETLFEKPSFKQAAMHRTGLLPVQGFLEWHHGYRRKDPYLVRHKSEVFLTLGCIWEEWVNPRSGEVVPSLSIITTPSNKLMSWVHNARKRMPLIVPPGDREAWLKGIAPEDVERLQSPFPDGELEAIRLKDEVSKVRINIGDISLHEAVGDPLSVAPFDSLNLDVLGIASSRQ
jgi:putative SOS response-associated peptidase YedK